MFQWIAGLAYAYVHVSPWSAVIFVGPAIAAQRYFVLYREQARATNELESAVAKLSRVNLSFATALVTALDARDHYTAGHSAARRNLRAAIFCDLRPGTITERAGKGSPIVGFSTTS